MTVFSKRTSKHSAVHIVNIHKPELAHMSKFICKENYILELVNADYNILFLKFLKLENSLKREKISLMLKFKVIDIPSEL